MLPEQICSILLYPGQVLPHSEVIAGVTIAGSLLWVLATLLPIQLELLPVIGAALAGYETHKHKLVAFIVIYVFVSVWIVAGKIPLCGA